MGYVQVYNNGGEGFILGSMRRWWWSLVEGEETAQLKVRIPEILKEACEKKPE